jgi:hypothetical protein
VRKITTAGKKLTPPKKDTSPTKASTTTLKSQLPNNKSLPPKTKHQICHKIEGDSATNSATESPTTRQRKTITATYVAANISEGKKPKPHRLYLAATYPKTLSHNKVHDFTPL